MKNLVAYYSKTGNTERVAKEIASLLGSDTEKIIDKKNRKGIFGFIFGGRDAMKEQKTEIGENSKDPKDYDLVIVGTPIWASSITPAIRTYIDKNRANFKRWAFFITSGGTDAEQVRASMEKAVGKKAVACFSLTAKELSDKNIFKEKIASFAGAMGK